MYFNDDGDFTVKKLGISEDGERFVKFITHQSNGWKRIFIAYEDGTTEELFEKETD